jgi:thiol-disulfide isomerase/thioredoxin
MDPDLDKEILMGEVNEVGLSDPIFVEDWQDSYDVYLPDRVVARKLKKIFRKNKDISIKVFMASWCGDSKQHLPHFVKLVHKTKLKNVSYYALNRQKQMDDLDFIGLSSFEIERVPTFIVYKGGKEIGRIVETPKVSLEKDILNICQ